jgi:molecular chaperone Hsp33
LENGSLAEVLEAYFAQSEQLGAKFWLASDGQTSAGLMLQQLPAQLSHGTAREEQWQHLCTLAETISSAEMLDLPSETLLFKLYHEETVTLYPPTPILNVGAVASEVPTPLPYCRNQKKPIFSLNWVRSR